MTRPLSFIIALGVTVLAMAPAAARAQAPSKAQTQAKANANADASAEMPRASERPISVDYYNVPLQDVVRRLASFSGRTIVMRSEIGNPIVNASLANVHWRRALDLVLREQGLVARDDPSGVIRIERRDPTAKREPPRAAIGR